MTQIAQLSEAEIAEQFQIIGPRPIAFMLAGLARDGVQFSVHFQPAGEMFLTTVLAVQQDKGQFIFDCSGSIETNRRLLQSERNAFAGRPGGIHVQFSTGHAVEVTYDGAKAFAAPLPQYIVRMQRRESFRIETPRARPLQFFGRMPEGALLNLQVHDISVTGIGLVGSNLPEGIGSGLVLPNCRFSLPEDDQDLFFSATVRHASEFESRTGTRQWRLGLQFNDLPNAAQNRIQRYIDRIERERRELA